MGARQKSGVLKIRSKPVKDVKSEAPKLDDEDASDETNHSCTDLDEAINLFREEAQEALKIGEVSDWDGALLLRSERQMAQAALRLAAQCIALLLYLLAISKEANAQAGQRTRHLRHFGR